MQVSDRCLGGVGITLRQAVVGLRENWSFGESLYLSFITGLTIGYGDLVPLHFLTRLLFVLIGFVGILTTGLVAAISVRALQSTTAPAPPVSLLNSDHAIPAAQAQSSSVTSGRQDVVGNIADNAL